MKQKIITLLLVAMLILVGKSEAATLTQKLGGGYIQQSVNPGSRVTLKFINQEGFTFSNWIVESGNVTMDTTSSVVTFTMPNENVIIRANTVVQEYTITYNANGGTGSMANQTVTGGNSITLTTNTFSRSEYGFKGWAINPYGNVVYADGQSITPTSDMTLYAVWKQQATYTVNLYDASLGWNNWQLVDTISVTLAEDSYTYTLPGGTSLNGRYIIGWNPHYYGGGVHYTVGDTITLTRYENTINLYSMQDNDFIVCMHTNFGDGTYGVLDENIYPANANEILKFTIPEIETTMEGYDIIGWSTTPGSKVVQYNVGDTISLSGEEYCPSIYAVYNDEYHYALSITECCEMHSLDVLSGRSTETTYTFTLPPVDESFGDNYKYSYNGNTYSPGDTITLNATGQFTVGYVYVEEIVTVTYTVNLYDTEDYINDYIYVNNYNSINWQLVDTLTVTSAEDFYTFRLPEKTSLRGTYIMGWCQNGLSDLDYGPTSTITLSRWDNTVNLYAKATDNYRIYMHVVDSEGYYWADWIYNPDNSNYFTIPVIETTMEGYDIIGWSTTPGSKYVEYRAGDILYLNNGLSESLYAVYNNEYLSITECWDLHSIDVLLASSTSNMYTFTLPSIDLARHQNYYTYNEST